MKVTSSIECEGIFCKCEHCDKEYSNKEMKEHLNICKEALITCECGDIYKRKCLKEHNCIEFLRCLNNSLMIKHKVLIENNNRQVELDRKNIENQIKIEDLMLEIEKLKSQIKAKVNCESCKLNIICDVISFDILSVDVLKEIKKDNGDDININSNTITELKYLDNNKIIDIQQPKLINEDEIQITKPTKEAKEIQVDIIPSNSLLELNEKEDLILELENKVNTIETFLMELKCNMCGKLIVDIKSTEKCRVCKSLLCSNSSNNPNCGKKCFYCKNYSCSIHFNSCEDCKQTFCLADLNFCNSCKTRKCILCTNKNNCTNCSWQFDNRIKDKLLIIEEDGMLCRSLKTSGCVSNLCVGNQIFNKGVHNWELEVKNYLCNAMDFGLLAMKSKSYSNISQVSNSKKISLFQVMPEIFSNIQYDIIKFKLDLINKLFTIEFSNIRKIEIILDQEYYLPYFSICNNEIRLFHNYKVSPLV